MKEILVKIDEKSLEDMAIAINMRRLTDHFSGPIDAFAYVVGAAVENGHEYIQITNLKEMSYKLLELLQKTEVPKDGNLNM